MTENFVSAAELMCHVLGAATHEFVTIAHPISSASPEALGDRARIATSQIVRILTGEHH